MNIISTLEDYKQLLETFKKYEKQNKEVLSIGLAPTMGNLHSGHISLLKAALAENDIAIITIFVNPKQFSEDEDFDTYPRTVEQDILSISQSIKQSDQERTIIFIPKDNDVIFPKGFKSQIPTPPIANDLEGELRATHFEGVISVIDRLFTILKPTSAYFGKKDYQQFKIIELISKTYFPEIQIWGLPIFRELSGLAMSSRNNYLSAQQKEVALRLRSSLLKIKDVINETKDLSVTRELIKEIKQQDSRFNYLALKDAQTFREVESMSQEIVILGNYSLGETRILDNLELN